MKIHVYYHCALMGRYREVMAEQIKAMKDSWLLDKADSLTAYQLTGDNKLYEMGDKWTVHTDTDLTRYEFPTLQMMRKHAFNEPESAFCYLHTKGVSKPKFRQWLDDEWRRYMEFNIIDRWDECADGIRRGCDLAGCEWYRRLRPCRTGGIPDPEFQGFFAGNFFWASGRYLTTCPGIDSLDRQDRWQAEAWVGCGYKPIIHELLNLRCDERRGMFFRRFCRASYEYYHNIYWIDIINPANAKRRVHRYIKDHCGTECIVFVRGLNQKYLDLPNAFQVCTEPRIYHYRVEI